MSATEITTTTGPMLFSTTSRAITIEGDCNGDITVSNSGSIGNITIGDIVGLTGDLGTGALISAGSIGDLSIGRTMFGDVDAATVGNVQIGLFLSSNGSITATTLGNVTVDDDLAGDITVNGNYSGTIRAEGVIGSLAVIQIDLDYTGAIIVASSCFGQINIDGNVNTSGIIAFNGANTTNSSLPGSLEIGGNLSGSVSAITMGQNGSILVNGNISAPGRIEIKGRTTGAPIAGDLTQNAQIKVLGDVTNTDDPPIHLYGSIVDGTSPDASRAQIVVGDDPNDQVSGERLHSK